MTDASDDDGQTAEDETPRGAREPEDLEDRDEGETDGRGIPPGVRDREENFRDKYAAAREDENLDQHRDEEEYD